MIIKKSPAEIDAMAAAGDILVRCMDLLAGKIRPGVTTGELDAAAERFIRSQGATPAFKGYRGFPGSICASPNHMVVHGIPGAFKLGPGDILSVDIGVVKDGWVADAARTFPVGHVSPVAEKLLEVTRESLFKAVEQCWPGNHLGDVGHAVQQHVEGAGFSVVRSLVTGHPWAAEVAPLTGPMYQLYIFFMITDPKTTVRSKKGQILVAFLVAAAEAVFRLLQFVHAPYYALFVVGPIANLIEIAQTRRARPAAAA